MSHTVAQVVFELSKFLEEISGKPSLMKSQDSTFILDRVKDLWKPRTTNRVNLLSLPREILFSIFPLLTPDDMLQATRTWQELRETIDRCLYWKKKCLYTFPINPRYGLNYKEWFFRMRKRPYKLITESSKIEISGSLIEHCAADIEV